jgi:hypothetical protein
MSILAGEKFTSQLVKKYVRRDMLMNSPIYNEWVEEERREAAEKAAKETAIKTTKENMIDLLEEKFDIIPQSVYDKIDKIDKLNSLQMLNKKIIKVDTIEKFEKLVDSKLNYNSHS